MTLPMDLTKQLKVRLSFWVSLPSSFCDLQHYWGYWIQEMSLPALPEDDKTTIFLKTQEEG